MSIELIIGIVSIFGSLSAIALSLRKYPFESRNMDALAAKSYAEAARSSADRAKEIAGEFEKYQLETESELKRLNDEIRSLKITLKERQETLEDLRDWAERLVHQVQSLGSEPVKMRQRKNL